LQRIVLDIPEKLIFAFDCVHLHVVAQPTTRNERAVDMQDQFEFYLWSGRQVDTFICFEVAARQAVHDYRTKFYRFFNTAWTPEDFNCAVALTERGFSMEAEVSHSSAMIVRVTEWSMAETTSPACSLEMPRQRNQGSLFPS